MNLSAERKQKALEILKLFSASGELIKVKEGEFMKREEFQQLRKDVAKDVASLIKDFLEGRIELDLFKTRVDGINKKSLLWGFRGIKGQMFFNQLCNAARDKVILAKKLREAISLPLDVKQAMKKMEEFIDFVHNVSFSDKKRAPNEKSVPYFLSYFWQIQNPDKFPIYYTSLEQVFTELDFMPSDIEILSDKYHFFYELNNELRELFAKETGSGFSYWDVEHVFWYYNNSKADILRKPESQKKISLIAEEVDYIPPIVQEIPALARGDESVAKKYEEEGKRIEDVLEDKVSKLFIMLGFEVNKLGKGKGREPDGITKARQESYAIIYDTKSRMLDYNIGTDDRAIKEYIEKHSRSLKKEGFRNIYFIIISSSFRQSQEDIIKRIKIETGIQEILLLKADLLLYILELKLRDSIIDLASLQEVFHNSGIISSEYIQELLTGR